ncbi:MAG: lyase family protein, partial [Candidatus Diapherotrites archaeon]|nr:lyase family protein [Candidatus Diapherotrites archaeon]
IDFRYFGGKPELKEKAEKFLTETAMKKYMAKVEAALAKKLAENGVCSKEIADEIQKACNSISLEKLFQEDKKTNHERRALVNAIRDKVSDKAKPFVHFTLTSNDVLDTANALRYKEFTEQILLPSILELEKLLINLSLQEKNTLQIGRTHGQHALPLTFGSYLVGYVSRFGGRIKKIKHSTKELRGKISGAIGNYNALGLFVKNPIEFERELLDELGLKSSPTSTQIVEDEFLLDYLHALTSMLGVIANLADDFRHLQRTEIAELNEKFESGQVGSSTMPHKKNPLTFENLKGVWKEFMPRMMTAYLDQVSEHQRDLTNSSTKRFVPETVFIIYYASETLRQALQKIEINK